VENPKALRSKIFKFDSITWYKDLSPEISGLRYSRDDDHSIESINGNEVEGPISKLLFIAPAFVYKPGSSGNLRSFTDESALN
jgi:hypothetical protein